MTTQDDLEAEGKHGFSEEAEQDWIDASYKGVIEEKDLPPEIARDSEIFEAICTHTKNASAHHTAISTHAELPDLTGDCHPDHLNNARGDARYLYRENVAAFTPDGDYEPATKKYVDDAAGAGVSALNDLTDVVITGPADLDLLQYDVGSGKWVDRSLAEAGVAAASHAHAAGDITSGTFLDARIAQSNVTQHVGAIDHDSLLNFIANKHIDHTAVTITTTEGIQGGGTIAANRTFKADVNGLAVDGTPDEAADYVMTYDASASLHKKVLLNTLPSGGAHTHDGDTLQFDGVNSDGGAFTFTTTGAITFNSKQLKGLAEPTVQADAATKNYVDNAIGAGGHTHDTETLQLDGINSDGGSFAFNTTGNITFNQSLIVNADSEVLAVGALAGGDLKLYHDGAGTYIQNYTGILYVWQSVASPIRWYTDAAYQMELSATGDLSLINGDLVLPANGAIKVADGNPQIVFDNANNWLEITGSVGIDIAAPGVNLQIGGTAVDASKALYVSAGSAGTKTATVSLGTVARGWDIIAQAFPYELEFNYTGTDAPLANILTLLAGGSVGIGTATPATSLHVLGGAHLGQIIVEESGSSRLCLYQHAAYTSWILGGAYNDAGTIKHATTARSPLGLLFQHDSADDAYFAFYKDAHGTAGDTVVWDTVLMSIRDTGKVGIGTGTPTEKLEVLGTIKLGNDVSYNIVLPARGQRASFGTHGTISETLGGAGYFNANNVAASKVNSNKLIKTYSQADSAQYLGMRYDRGIWLGTGIGAGDPVGTEYDDNVNARVYIDLDGDVGIGAASPAAKLHIDQSSSTAAIPVLTLDQGDVSEECIKFRSDGVDRDINLFTVDVTGEGLYMKWEETNHRLRWQGNFHVGGAISSNLLILAGDSSNLNVSGVNTVICDCVDSNSILRACTGGVTGQHLFVVRKTATAFSATIHHNEGTGNQNMFLRSGVDETLTSSYGGWLFVCYSGNWYEVDY